MAERFVPLAAFLRPPPVAESLAVPAPAAADESAAAPSLPQGVAGEHVAALGAVRRFRAALADALEVAVQNLLREIAENVLARELSLAPADVASIVAKTRERFAPERVLAVRIHPLDRDALGELEVEKILDETLARGDAVAELHGGTIDLRLRSRLEFALAASVP
jgi:flagellar assembly protein FliH